MPSAAAISNTKYSVVDTMIGTVALTCLRPAPAPHVRLLPTSCFDGRSAALRLQSYWDGLYVQFNNLVVLDGHYVAKQISIENSSLAIVHVDVTELDFPAKVTDAEVAAPPSARVAPYTAHDPGLTGGRRAQWSTVEPPATTRSDHGTVMLEATVTKQGNVIDIQAVSGPEMFRQAAINELRTWKYTPYLLKGQPVEVRIKIDMSYGQILANGKVLY
jgi:TonB family protein